MWVDYENVCINRVAPIFNRCFVWSRIARYVVVRRNSNPIFKICLCKVYPIAHVGIERNLVFLKLRRVITFYDILPPVLFFLVNLPFRFRAILLLLVDNNLSVALLNFAEIYSLSDDTTVLRTLSVCSVLMLSFTSR